MTLKKKARHFIGALAITLIVIGMICGFMLVYLSSDRYMPGMFAPIYMIDSVGAHGVYFYWMGQAYLLEIKRVKEIQEIIWAWRGFIPRSARFAGGLVTMMFVD